MALPKKVGNTLDGILGSLPTLDVEFHLVSISRQDGIM